nr:ABC transporter substrate-binding protein [uncultured Helicobacter sp.]
MKLLQSFNPLQLWSKGTLLALAAFSIFGLNACKDNDLIVATSANFAPFEYIDGKEFKGIDMDIAEVIAKKLNKKLVIKDMEFDAVVTSLASGSADIALSGLTINETRSKVIDFTQTYFNASQMVITRAGDTRFENIATKEEILKTLQSIPNLKIGVQVGTTGEFYAKGDSDWGFEGFHNAQVKSFSNGALAATAMKNEQIDIVIIDEMPAREIIKANSGTQLIDIALTKEEYAIGIAPNNKELKDSVNAILDEMRQDGTLESIINKYYAQ